MHPEFATFFFILNYQMHLTSIVTPETFICDYDVKGNPTYWQWNIVISQLAPSSDRHGMLSLKFENGPESNITIG